MKWRAIATAAAFSLLPTVALAGQISPTGAAIEVESYRCEVKSPWGIECNNIGRACKAARAKAKQQDDYYIGCDTPEWKLNHPKESCPEDWYVFPMYCAPLMLGRP